MEAALAGPDWQPADSQYRYCSTDYILLGMLVEQATGQRVDAQVWQRIIKPLSLTDTTFPTVVVWQNGIDMHNPLSSDAPFVQAALAG